MSHEATAAKPVLHAAGAPGVASQAEAAGAKPVEVRVAGFWWRFGATLIDLVLLSGPLGFFWWSARDHLPRGMAAGIDYLVDMILGGDRIVHGGAIFSVAFTLFYFTCSTWLLGTSVGKWVARLRVVDLYGRKPGLPRSLLRTLGYVPSLLLCAGGFWWILFDRRKRGLHDLLAGTLVVRRAGAGAPTAGAGKATPSAAGRTTETKKAGSAEPAKPAELVVAAKPAELVLPPGTSEAPQPVEPADSAEPTDPGPRKP